MTSPVLAPLSFRDGRTSRNRVFLAPLTNRQSHADGTLSDDEYRFLTRRAQDGFGLVETCAAFVTQDGKAWGGELGVHDDAMLPGLTRLAKGIHDAGALASVQLFHGGRRADPEFSGMQPVSASAVEEPGSVTPREATEADLQRYVDAFAQAARRCAAAGFDAIELHGAHGYLLSQFLSRVYNRRTDGWGGSLEHRARLIREVTRAVKRAAPSLVLGVRLSPEDFGQAKGLDLDESLQVAKWLVEDGMELLHISLWTASRPTTKRPDAHPIPLFRAAVGPGVKLVTAGKIWSKEDAEGQLALGADAVALGRAAICNPDWVGLAIEGKGPVRQPPLTMAELEARGVSRTFGDYLRAWKGFVAD